MDDDLKVIIWLVGIVAMLIFSVVAACQITNWHDTNRIAVMTANGVAPIAAGCAVHGITEANREVCRQALNLK